VHDRARRVADVEDVDGRREGPAPAAGVEDVAEQLVDLTPHAVEVREEVAGGHRRGR
jgi:hypothetical protein